MFNLLKLSLLSKCSPPLFSLKHHFSCVFQAFLLRERVQIRSHLEKVRDAAKVRRYTEKWFRFSSDPPEKIRYDNNENENI